MVSYALVAAMLLTRTLGSYLDPINNMCQRFWHQSVVKNNVLYIDGGIQSFTAFNSSGYAVGPIITGYNEHLIVIPLNESWTLWNSATNSSNITEVALSKYTAPGVEGPVPQLVLGSLFGGPSSDDDTLWLYGGTTSWWNISFPGFQNITSDEYSLWGYSITNDTWIKRSVQPEVTYRPSAGFHTEAPELGLAFYYNGEIDSGSSLETYDLGSTDIFLEGMIVLNLTDQTATNISTAAVSQGYPRTRGAMLYIPGIGEKGILVAIGGTYKLVTQLDNDEQDSFVSMSQVDIFDVASLYSSNASAVDSAWYRQQTTGQAPANRASFCSVVAAAPDNSSYNIYIIGGNNQADNTFFDDVYILSIPSFTWTMVYGERYSPRYGQTCHRAANRQLVSVGGALGAGFNTCDFEGHGIAILDMTEITWNVDFNADDGPYQVPEAIVQVIGGGPNGSATMLAPEDGYTDLALATLMGNPSAYRSSNSSSSGTTTTSTTTSHTSHTGAIVGGVVGGVLGLALLLALLFFLLRRRNKQRATTAASTSQHQDADRPMMTQTTSDMDSAAALDSTASPATELHTDAGPYGEYTHPQELGTKDQSVWAQAELEGKTDAPGAELPINEHVPRAELVGSEDHVHELGGVRDSRVLPVERYELPGHDLR